MSVGDGGLPVGAAVTGDQRMLFRRTKTIRDPLDDLIFRLTAGDPFNIRHLLNSVCVFGRTGSGKSSGFGRMAMYSLAAHPLFCGLVLAAKPEDKGEWQAAFKAAGREKDLVVVEPGGAHRLNVLDYIARSGGDAREIVRCLMNINETLRTSDSSGGENADFFQRETERQLYHAVVIVMAATGGASAPDLQRFVNGAARNPQQIADATWQAGFHHQCIKKAMTNAKAGREKHDVELAIDYELGELPGMADRTRSSIEVGSLGLLHVICSGLASSLLSEGTTISPDDVLAGKTILVNVPPAEFGDTGACVNAAFKYVMQRRMLRRVFKPGERFVLIYADEAQQFVNSYDSTYLAQCRSHGGGMVYLTQSKHSYYAALHGQKGRHQVDALLSNFGLKVFNALGDIETAEWASNLCGKERKLYMGGSTSPDEDVFDAMFGSTRFSGSFNEQLHPIIEAHEFLNGLATGGAANAFLVSAICVRSAEPFSNGRNFIRTSFSQR